MGERGVGVRQGPGKGRATKAEESAVRGWPVGGSRSLASVRGRRD